MPGLNPTGEPRTTDYNLGRGRVYFSLLDANSLPICWRDLGNAPEFGITVETERLDHKSSRQGLKLVDKEVEISKKVTVRVVLDELNFENLALFFSGEGVSRANAGGTPITGAANVTVTDQGRWYDLYADASGMPASDIQAKRIYDIGEVTITPTAGGSALVEGTDYDVDQEFGRIFVIDGGDMVAGDYDVDVAANATASATVDEVKSLTASAAVGALKFISVNPADGDRETEYNFHQVRLSSEGEVPLIGDEWTTLTLQGTAESNAAADPDSQTLTIVTNPNQA